MIIPLDNLDLRWRGLMKAFSFVCLSAAIVLSSSAHAEMKNTMADCGTFVDGWKAAYNAKNADALAGMYDATSGTYSGSFWTASGHDALLAGFKQDVNSGSTMISIKCDHAAMAGDFGASDGTWSATAKGPDGKDATIGGRWLSTVEFKDGKYLILTHLGNMQLPTPGVPK